MHPRTEVLSISSLTAEWGWWLLPGHGTNLCIWSNVMHLNFITHVLLPYSKSWKEIFMHWNFNYFETQQYDTFWYQLLDNKFVDHQLQQIKFHSHTTKFIPSWIKVSISTALFIVIDKCGHSTQGLYLLCQTNTCIFYVHHTQVQGEFFVFWLFLMSLSIVLWWQTSLLWCHICTQY